ncbi:MAG TPA: hypothetical protein VGC49_01460 [Solirubrobacterales bacterium]
MSRHPDQPAAARADATLGRLGGLAPEEADRGEKALWLAGPGYRAALFHLGALTRLNELGMLAQIGTVGAVSGGSILAALLATQVPWPLHGAYRDWPEKVAQPLREIVRRNARARALLRRPLPGIAADAALEERYARELVESLGGESRWGPRFVFGASGLTLSGLAAGWEECVQWHFGATRHPPGYSPALVTQTISAVRTDLDAFGEAEQAVLENHGYLAADAALRDHDLGTLGGIACGPPEPPHPDWMAEERARAALAASGRRTLLGRLRPRGSGVGKRRGQPTSAELTVLLRRHRPLLQYDSLESFRADSVATICEHAVPGRCNTLHRGDGSLIAAAAPAPGEPRLDLDFLDGTTYANGEAVHDDDFLDECGGSHAADAAALRARPDAADVVYGRARHDEDGVLWLQYWFFHYYDDRGMLGLEQREGDWEMVQLRLGDGGVPDAATFAQPVGAERIGWEELELASTGDGQAPVVFPSRGSHVPRPRPGSFAAAIVADRNDGLGPRLRPRLEPIGDDGPGWVLWPGRWGSTRRREYFERDSPRGPRQQHWWWDPAELHAEARPWGDPEGAGGLTPPPRPRVEARREGHLALVSYGFPEPSAGEAEPARIVAAPFDGSDEPSAAHAFPVEGRQGTLALQLPPGRSWAGVRLAAVSADRGASGATITTAFEKQERAG